MPRPTRNLIICIAAITCCWTTAALALSSDRDQQMFIEAHYQKSTQNPDGNSTMPDITDFDGNVVITQGSMKAYGDHATIYKNPSSVVDAKGNAGSLTRVVLVGKQAHMQQVHDGDCSLMTADANTIDYHNDTDIAILTGHVVVVQKDKGESRSEYMIYHRDTGEMESGDKSASSRVHIVMEPKSAQPAVKDTNNCGFPVGNYKPKAAKPAATTPAAKPKDQP